MQSWRRSNNGSIQTIKTYTLNSLKLIWRNYWVSLVLVWGWCWWREWRWWRRYLRESTPMHRWLHWESSWGRRQTNSNDDGNNKIIIIYLVLLKEYFTSACGWLLACKSTFAGCYLFVFESLPLLFYDVLWNVIICGHPTKSAKFMNLHHFMFMEI